MSIEEKESKEKCHGGDQTPEIVITKPCVI